MSIALQEARKGLGYTSPNPMVGAVIVKNGEIISTGYHRASGEDHAEVDAIKNAGEVCLKNSVLYVTLEPCCHFGKTPPCTRTVIEAGFKTVVIASLDEDIRVKNKSVSILENAGISVITGVLKEEAERLNFIYFHFKKHKRPYIVLKAALTLDGKIAAHTGDSKWISNQKSRERVHKLRSRLSAIALGGNTLLSDKPRLNCRLKGFEQKPVHKLIFSGSPLEGSTGCLAGNPGKIYQISPARYSNPDEFIQFCLEHSLDSILIEGGGRLYSWFLTNKLVDTLYLFYKPSFLGNDGVPVFTGMGTASIGELVEFSLVRVEKIENNILVIASKGGESCLPE